MYGASTASIRRVNTVSRFMPVGLLLDGHTAANAGMIHLDHSALHLCRNFRMNGLTDVRRPGAAVST
jgi:hypothetical protein